MSEARFPPIPEKELSEQQKKSHDEILGIVEPMFKDKGFKFQREDGALLGPCASLVYAPPSVGHHMMSLIRELGNIEGLPLPAKEAAILTAGALTGCRYELYAHSAVAQSIGALSKTQVEKLSKGELPNTEDGELTSAAGVKLAWEIARALIQSPGPLQPALWEQAVQAFGPEASMALVHFVGFYTYLSILMNGLDVPVPE